MKTIRYNCFETNSSSTHSLCIFKNQYKYIKGEDFDSPFMPIITEASLKSFKIDNEFKHKAFVCKITTSNWYKRQDGFYLVKGAEQKNTIYRFHAEYIQ